MGRLIISETEKKNILSLYESTNVAPPPSESILIDNKNPFKSENYKLFNNGKITLYSSNLKNNDFFYSLNFKSLEQYVLNKINNLLLDKSIRLNGNGVEDKIYNIEKFKYCSLYGSSGYNVSNVSPTYSESLCFIDIATNAPNYSGVDLFEISTLSRSKLLDITYSHVMEKSFPYQHETMKVNNYSVSDDTMNKIYDIIKEWLTWSKLPDEYFEIRKIQRQQTDL
jgi:hypothetical protein